MVLVPSNGLAQANPEASSGGRFGEGSTRLAPDRYASPGGIYRNATRGVTMGYGAASPRREN